MVNHSENFVDPYRGAHTNTIQGLWGQVKRKLKSMFGTFKDKLPGYLDELNWQRLFPGDCFENMLQHVADLYPVSLGYLPVFNKQTNVYYQCTYVTFYRP